MKTSWEELSERQPVATKMLKNAVIKNRVAHAYLFEGPRGTGKRELALYYAKVLLCENVSEATPCGTCRNCRRVDSGNHPNVYLIKPEETSIKKHQIQELQEEFAKTAVESNRKIYIIDHADRMTTNAANSLLKFLEEPISITTAFLLTEQVQQILPTILSRCQSIHFNPLPTKYFEEHLGKIELQSNIIPLLARLTNSEAVAVQIAEEEWFAQARDLVIELYEALLTTKKDSLLVMQQNVSRHFDTKEQLQMMLDMLVLAFKDMLYIYAEQDQNVVFKNEESLMRQALNRISLEKITTCLEIILDAKKRLTSNANMLMVLEQMIIELQEGL
ncbi:DNA polymerase III subunit delta' [Bacillus sp. AFS041924]|uniref:DNA polymerase III subunit delta' n=1 Tax=Bacillus sp. AFS041924 TaxID=2033503 RepID=UPI000BFC04BA|nr:DNA polymerase III subunit delta' [Bacillus sp. AFS041924]PGS49514.1 DNA polymerase III subunit delta' [Bacillus sp. AFS041924]